MAIQHMAHKELEPGQVTNTREVAEAYCIPYPLLAKVMQQLASKGLIKSIHGTKGGYQLAKRAEDIAVSDVVEIFDGRVAVADCFKEAKITCPQWDGCSLKNPLAELNRKIYALLSHTTIKDLSGDHDIEKLWSEKDKGLPVYGSN